MGIENTPKIKRCTVAITRRTQKKKIEISKGQIQRWKEKKKHRVDMEEAMYRTYILTQQSILVLSI